MPKLKKCTKCKKEKDLSEFYIDRTTKDGYYPSCKKCKYEKGSNEKRKIMTCQEKIIQELKQNGSVLLKDLLNNFDNKKELFTDLKELTDARKIGFSEIVGQGLKYYVKM